MKEKEKEASSKEPYPLPKDTRGILWKDEERRPTSDSISLLLSKYANPNQKGKERKNFLIKTLEQCECRDWIMRRCKAHVDFLLGLWPKGATLEDFLLLGRLRSRLMVNMSGGVLENAGLCLDRFGVPYIPGSAVKGCARRAAIAFLKFCKDDPPPKESLWPSLSQRVQENGKNQLALESLWIFGWTPEDWKEESDWAYAFGGKEAWEGIKGLLVKSLAHRLGISLREEGKEPKLPNFAGVVRFFPAYPVPGKEEEQNPFRLELDVITCHHMDYYAGKKETATDDEDPNPVYFPAVAHGSVFAFPLLLRKNGHKEHFSLAKEFLSVGLQDFGIGAKTSAGYGWFDTQRDSLQGAASYIKNRKDEAEKKPALLKPEPKILEELRRLKPDQLRNRINQFCEEERYWPQKEKENEIYQYTLIWYLLRENLSLYHEVKGTPSNKSYRGIRNLVKKFSLPLP